MWVSEIIDIAQWNKHLFDKCRITMTFLHPVWIDKLKSFVNGCLTVNNGCPSVNKCRISVNNG